MAIYVKHRPQALAFCVYVRAMSWFCKCYLLR